MHDRWVHVCMNMRTYVHDCVYMRACVWVHVLLLAFEEERFSPGSTNRSVTIMCISRALFQKVNNRVDLTAAAEK